MNLWRRLRIELAGAWRSLRYDMGRRAPVPAGDPRTPGPDVTYTGWSTFGMPVESVPIGADEKPRRPLAAVSVFVLLAVVGAAASYLAVVNGLGSLLREKPAAPRSYPMAAAPPDTGDSSNAGLGRAAGQAVTPSGTRTTAVLKTDKPAPPTRPDPPQTSRPELGGMPPVPTPTAPSPAPSPAPSTEPEPSAGPSDAPSPAPSASDPGSAGPSADASGEALVRHRHRHRY